MTRMGGLAAELKRLRERSDRAAPGVLVGGVLAGVAFNLARWPRDAARARALRRAACDEPKRLPGAPRVSILVAAWNERSVIERHIESVQRLRYPDLEHIVCAGGDDGTYELSLQHHGPSLVVLRQRPAEGKQRALARCLEIATGTIVVLTDSDCILDDTSFERLVAPILSGAEQASTGIFRPLPEQLNTILVVHRWAATTYRFLQAKQYVEGLTGANAAIRTTTLRTSEGLNASTWIGDDTYLAGRLMRMGHRIRFVAHSEVAVHFEEHFTSYARQRSRWLGGILIHALARRDWYQVGVVAVFYAVGQAFVWLPLSVPLVGRGALAVWLGGLACAILNRLRYLAFTSARSGVRLQPAILLASPWMVSLDLLALAYAPLDVVLRLRTKRW